MKLLRKLFILLLVLIIIYILIFVSINFIFQDTIKKNLEKRFQVNIKGFKIDLITSINFKDVSIKRFYLNISQINFKYQPLSLFRNRFKGKIEFKDLYITYEDLKIKENILINFSFKPLIFSKILEIEEISLQLDGIPTLRTKGKLQPIFKPQKISLQTEIPSLSYPDFVLKDLSLNLNLSRKEFFGDFLIRNLNYKKFRLNNISSEIFFQERKMYLENLKADIFEGELSGEVEIFFLPSLSYDLNLKMTSLNLEKITQRFAPPDWRAKGEISGDLKLRIEGRDPKDLKASLYSQRPGAINMKAIRRLFSETKVGIDKEILKKNVFPYENLTGEISLLGDDIIVKLDLVGKEAELKFDIKIEKEALFSFLLGGGYLE